MANENVSDNGITNTANGTHRRGSPQITFRAGPVEEHLASRAGQRSSASEVAKRDLERAYTLLALELRRSRLSEGEASLIVDACRTWLVTPDTIPYLWSEVADSDEHEDTGEKWGVALRDLTPKLRALGPLRSWAVVDAVERFWRLVAEDDPRTRVELLVEVGLLHPDTLAPETKAPRVRHHQGA